MEPVNHSPNRATCVQCACRWAVKQCPMVLALDHSLLSACLGALGWPCQQDKSPLLPHRYPGDQQGGSLVLLVNVSMCPFGDGKPGPSAVCPFSFVKAMCPPFPPGVKPQHFVTGPWSSRSTLSLTSSRLSPCSKLGGTSSRPDCCARCHPMSEALGTE